MGAWLWVLLVALILLLGVLSLGVRRRRSRRGGVIVTAAAPDGTRRSRKDVSP